MTGKSKRGRSMYRKIFSDFSVAACSAVSTARLGLGRWRALLTEWISSILRNAILSSQSDFGRSPRSYFFTSYPRIELEDAKHSLTALTFSRRPISSWVTSLLGVVVSSEPSASTPGHSRRRCLPRRSVLPRAAQHKKQGHGGEDERSARTARNARTTSCQTGEMSTHPLARPRGDPQCPIR